MDYSERLIVKPGEKLRLADIDPGFHGHNESHEKAMPELGEALAGITRLQELLYAQKKHALLVVLQGIDAAGKDGVCWHVIQAMNPQGTRVTGFKQPTAEERAHDFLWRIHNAVPGLGQVGVFNRSHYEDVLVVRVHGLAPKKVWEKRYDAINAFERQLSEAGVTILKFFLYISKEEQLERFKKRLDDPARHWKISEADYAERALWDDYVKAYEAMLTKCSTDYAPWYVIPSNHKWFRNLAASRIILETLEGMKLKAPEPTVDLDEIRAKYHKAEEEG
ncbi:polyphosphate kinase 2 family protein [Hoeflea prorocentri]|uniref:Polyphosphate kinase 2 family protein n=1 Tax=Hoeflea prorocentri TaxID=1922333 RepID=A0A9X3UKK3_9HYPH|nr:polyphosphate kinase 2 family protein [Hoeflea prorocentri]MCY6382115.1 polyphosphate kinase 2 family protein [Hoeflea prorocentri]MDA5399915.1 polyphosphate kinase 2 family protein [Hoeflea prorocentri]